MMNFRISLDPFSAPPYFTVQEHLYKYSGVEEVEEKLKSAEKRLREFLSLDSSYQFSIIPKADKDRWLQESGTMVMLDNPFEGTNELLSNSASFTGEEILDISYSFPQLTLQDLSSFKVIVCDASASLGIPVGFVFVFSKNTGMGLYPFQQEQQEAFEKDIYILSSVLDDLHEKTIEVLMRESNYKSAVLYQLIDSNPNLTSLVSRESRSKSVITAECESEFADRIEKLGYQMYRREHEGKARISIANYATLSKELIEMFADRISEL